MSSSSDGSWSTKAYTQKLSFVCEKPVGGKKIVTIEGHKFTKKSSTILVNFFLINSQSKLRNIQTIIRP